MGTIIKLKRGQELNVQNASLEPAEPVVDLENKVLYIGEDFTTNKFKVGPLQDEDVKESLEVDSSDSLLHSKWDGDCEYVYDSNDNIETVYFPNSTNPLRKWEMTYDIDGNIITEKYYRYESSTWVFVSKYTYTYNANDDIISRSYSIVDL